MTNLEDVRRREAAVEDACAVRNAEIAALEAERDRHIKDYASAMETVAELEDENEQLQAERDRLRDTIGVARDALIRQDVEAAARVLSAALSSDHDIALDEETTDAG